MRQDAPLRTLVRRRGGRRALLAFVDRRRRRLVRARRRPPRPAASRTFTADALEAHKLYVVEVRHPVEVPGSERPHLTAWLTKRLGYAQRIPDLQSLGLKLVGGRLLPGPHGDAAALYMYEGASGERFTVYCSQAKAPESALRFKSGGRFAAFYWVDDKRAFVVSGPAERAKLERMSKMVYEQVDKGGDEEVVISRDPCADHTA